jgi:hypothetical protein
MKTDDLIRALAADAPLRDPGLRRQVALAMASGLLVALALFLWLLGPRANALQSLDSLRFLLKFAITLSLAVAATGLVLRLIHPGLPLGPWRLAVFLAPGLLLLAGVGLELVVLPASDWSAALVGRNARTCLTYIPLMGLAPLGLLLLALRRGAPGHPALAGGVAGLVAGGFSAALYAAHCPDDSPLFVVTWYSIGIAVLVALGALIGRRVLRW